MCDQVAPRWVLHVCPPNGGGVDRFVRDVCRRRPQDWIAHVSVTQCVLEQPSTGQMIALQWEQLKPALMSGALGTPATLHAHSTEPNVSQFCALWGRDIARIVTLHDINFVGKGDTPPQRKARHQFISDAHMLTVPSEFIAGVLRTTNGLETLVCRVVENGADPFSANAPSDQPASTIACAVAVVGAIGPHKGWDCLKAVIAALPEAMPLVLLGYVEQKLTQGWLIPGKLWVHGAFQLEELPVLAKRYGVRLAFFPPGQPESFCYALSDAWLAGLPVLAPDMGALGERVHKYGGGHLYDPHASPAMLVASLLTMTESQVNHCQLDEAKRSISSVECMVNTLEHIYTESSVVSDTQPPQIAVLQAYMARHLDSAFFRRELINLDGQLAQLARERDAALIELAQLAQIQRERMEWQAHLERDIEVLNQQMRILTEQTLHQLKDELSQSQAAQARMAERLEKLMCWLPKALTDRILHRLTK